MSKQWALGKAKVSPYAEWMMLRLLCELDGAYLFFQPQQRVRSKAEQRLRRMNGMEEEETVVFCWSSNAVARALGLPEELAFAPQGEAIARVLLDARWQAVRDMPPERPVAMPEATDDEVPEGPGEPRFWAAAYTNLHVVAEALALDAVEIAVLRLVLHLAVERPLRKAGQLVSADNFSAAMMQMAHLLDVPRKALRRAVGKRGKLRRYGLLSCRDDVRREVCDLEDALQWGDLFDADDFVLEKQERAQLLRSCLPAAGGKRHARLGRFRPYRRTARNPAALSTPCFGRGTAWGERAALRRTRYRQKPVCRRARTRTRRALLCTAARG